MGWAKTSPPSSSASPGGIYWQRRISVLPHVSFMSSVGDEGMRVSFLLLLWQGFNRRFNCLHSDSLHTVHVCVFVCVLARGSDLNDVVLVSINLPVIAVDVVFAFSLQPTFPVMILKPRLDYLHLSATSQYSHCWAMFRAAVRERTSWRRSVCKKIKKNSEKNPVLQT